jgi:hypothetical protein
MVKFWASVANVTNADGEPKFKQVVTKLATALLSLPFSNASVKRLFSLMNATHTKIRNRLHISTVEALLRIRYGLLRRGEMCVTFSPSNEMVSHFLDAGDSDDNKRVKSTTVTASQIATGGDDDGSDIVLTDDAL